MPVTADIPREFNLSIEFYEVAILIPIPIGILHLWDSLARI
jgi:hypothetical protein